MTNQPKKPLTKEQEYILWHKHYEEMNRRREEQPRRYKRNQ